MSALALALLLALSWPRAAQLPGPVGLAGSEAAAAALREALADRAVWVSASLGEDGAVALALVEPAAQRVVAPALADERELAAWLARLEPAELTVELAGGSPLAWGAALRAPRPTPFARALEEAHAQGAAIVASGRTAAALAEAAIAAPGELARPRRNPRTARAALPVWNVGSSGLEWVEVQSGAPASFERLLAMLCTRGARGGVFLGRDAALLAGGEPGAARGDFRVLAGCVLVLDLRRARRSSTWLLGARLSLLAAGDAWSARAPCRASSAEPAASGPLERARAADALDAAALGGALERFGQSGAPRAIELADERTAVVLALDEDARAAQGRACAVRFDVVRARPWSAALESD